MSKNNHILSLHWKLFIPLVALLWVIIGITIFYFVSHEKQRQRDNLENRLLNVNNTVIEAYEKGADLQKTVDFIKLFTDKTTLAPLRITVYDRTGRMVADNDAETIRLYDENGNPDTELVELLEQGGKNALKDVDYNNNRAMLSAKASEDGLIYSFAALPYEGAVVDFLRIDPMVWVIVITLGLLSSILAYMGVRAVCRNVYSLRDFARSIATDNVTADIDKLRFSKDELGDVSRDLMTLYRDKIQAEQEKMHHERQIAMNVSHELNTPVSIIKGYIDTVLNTPDMPDDVKQKFLMRAKQNADRLAHLISDVSTVMRIEESGDRIETDSVNMRSVVSRIAEDIVLGHIADGMTFEFDIPDNVVVAGHESLLTNALLNLIYNSARHSDGTRMTLKYEGMTDGQHVFTFADNGKGVEAEHIGRLFDMFYFSR